MEARIDNYRGWVKGCDAEKLKPATEKLVVESGFTVLNFMEHHFEPQGYTAIWLLAESHCALHTFPEQEKSYIELSSCNVQMYDNFLRLLGNYFELDNNN
ncbi:MAG: S-adenosylmethionine decarboxylase [Cyclobacteriaceae bacterium]